MATAEKMPEKAKKEKTFRFRIETTKEVEQRSVNERIDAISIIADLQTKKEPQILFHDDKEQKTVCYTKSRYEQNYRVKEGIYTQPQTQKPEDLEATTKTAL